MDRKSQVYALYDALFLLEDMRDVYRESIPRELTEKEQSKINKKIGKIRKILDKLESQKGTQKQYIVDRLAPRIREEAFINIQPIQAGGRLTVQARKALIAYGDGYSVCDECLSPFRLDKIKNPPLDVFHKELADFLGMDEARVVPGARRGFQTVINSLVGTGDTVVLSSLGHYTEFLAVEQVGGIPKEVPSENNIVTGEKYNKKIAEVKKETGRLPKLVMVDHFDYMYGNEHEIQEIAKAAHEYNIPFLLNGAYSVGVMPVNGKDIGADFVVGSGHKSMASAAPSGVVATTDEWADTVFRTTGVKGDVTGRTFGIKEVEMLGCTLMGAPIVTMMASFPAVKKRVQTWDEEVKKSNYFIEKFKGITGTKILSEEPRKHTLTKVDTTQSFDTVAKTHKKRGYFLSSDLKKRGIAGPFAGATRKWKLNTYGLTWDQIKYVSDAFCEIAQKHGLPVTG
ncbi:MAG: O-phospho-L-seryl-tRNA:Cys-tRNA synthase [Candidatus Methanofastidiosia archaeon]|jgi:Sep-tRNA:Cys-tRNA synthetase